MAGPTQESLERIRHQAYAACLRDRQPAPSPHEPWSASDMAWLSGVDDAMQVLEEGSGEAEAAAMVSPPEGSDAPVAAEEVSLQGPGTHDEQLALF